MRYPSGEVYGFVVYLASLLLFLLFLAWSLLPPASLPFLLPLLPNPYWSILLPLYSFFLFLSFIPLFCAINLKNTPHLTCLYTITDPYSNLSPTPPPRLSGSGLDWIWMNKSNPPGFVLDWKEWDDDEPAAVVEIKDVSIHDINAALFDGLQPDHVHFVPPLD